MVLTFASELSQHALIDLAARNCSGSAKLSARLSYKSLQFVGRDTTLVVPLCESNQQ